MTNDAFVAYVLDQLHELGAVQTKKFFASLLVVSFLFASTAPDFSEHVVPPPTVTREVRRY